MAISYKFALKFSHVVPVCYNTLCKSFRSLAQLQTRLRIHYIKVGKLDVCESLVNLVTYEHSVLTYYIIAFGVVCPDSLLLEMHHCMCNHIAS